MNFSPPSIFRVIALVVHGSFIEMFRRRDIYVLLILMAVFSLGMILARAVGVTDAATSAFLLNLGMTMAQYFAHVLVLLIAVRGLAAERENRTLYSLLACPVQRSAVLSGKWLAAWMGGLVVFAVLFLLAWVPAPKIAEPDRILLVQNLVLQLFSLGLLAALGICLTLLMPHSLAIIVAGGWYFAGHIITGFLQRGAGLRQWLSDYLVDFNRLNLATRYTDGIAALDAAVMGGLMLYAVLFIAVLYMIANAIFCRTSI